MPASSVNLALQYLRARFAGQKAEGQSDQYLLEQFVVQSDESAFAALLQRHGPMAMGVCLRVLNDEHLAEDALQATFLVLAMKAKSIRKRGSLASWIYGVALRLARKAKADARRARQSVEREVPEGPLAQPLEASRREEQELLEQEFARLPDKFRLPLVLCYFEGLTHEQAAAQLACSKRQVKSLLAQGRERLRLRLSRRGLAVSAASLAAVLDEAAWTATIAPRLAVQTVHASMKLGSGSPLAEIGVSASVIRLVKGAMTMSLKKVVFILALALSTISIGAAIWAGTGRGQSPAADQKLFGAVQNRPVQAPVPAEQNPTLVAENRPTDPFAAQEKKDAKDKEDAVEEVVIDRLIDVFKGNDYSITRRWKACVALAKRGNKAKRAEPDIIKFFERALPGGAGGEGGRIDDPDVNGNDVLRFFTDTVRALMAVAENKDGTVNNSKEAVAIYGRLLVEISKEAEFAPVVPAITEALGRNCSKEALAILVNAGNRTDQMKPVRLAVISGLERMGCGADPDIRIKARAELQILAETDSDTEVQALAQKALSNLRGEKKAPH